MIFTVTGASGVGKTSVMRRLMGLSGVCVSNGPTTRAPRESDLPGEYLYLASHEDFEKMGRDGGYAWRVEFSGRLYGSLNRVIESELRSARVALLSITPDCVTTLHAFARERGLESHVRSVYMLSPGADVLIQRMHVNRRESHEAARAKTERCSGWDLDALNQRHYHAYIPDRDDLEEKITRATHALKHPW